MKTSPKNGRKKPLYGPNIVRAWFDTVLYHALRGLEEERGFLERRNWTYRFHLDALEYLAPLAEHLPGSARDNLEQFLSFFPAIRVLIDEHNYGTARLARTCSEFHAALLASPLFDDVFDSVEADAPAALGGEFSNHFGAFSTKEQFRGLLAEYLVNNIRENPGYYTTARLWKRYNEQFFSVLDEPGLASHRQAADACGHGLSEAVAKLAGAFREERSDLSLKFDVPIAIEMASVD